MQVRFKCPACKGTHITDIPETTIHLTCSRTNKPLELRLTPGGDVKSRIVGVNGEQADEETEEE
jgi:hypothetical protein